MGAALEWLRRLKASECGRYEPPLKDVQCCAAPAHRVRSLHWSTTQGVIGVQGHP